jgi:hypothetical protein
VARKQEMRTSNHSVQATPVCVSREFLSQVSGAPDLKRSAKLPSP